MIIINNFTNIPAKQCFLRRTVKVLCPNSSIFGTWPATTPQALSKPQWVSPWIVHSKTCWGRCFLNVIIANHGASLLLIIQDVQQTFERCLVYGCLEGRIDSAYGKLNCSQKLMCCMLQNKHAKEIDTTCWWSTCSLSYEPLCATLHELQCTDTNPTISHIIHSSQRCNRKAATSNKAYLPSKAEAMRKKQLKPREDTPKLDPSRTMAERKSEISSNLDMAPTESWPKRAWIIPQGRSSNWRIPTEPGTCQVESPIFPARTCLMKRKQKQRQPIEMERNVANRHPVFLEHLLTWTCW